MVMIVACFGLFRVFLLDLLALLLLALPLGLEPRAHLRLREPAVVSEPRQRGALGRAAAEVGPGRLQALLLRRRDARRVGHRRRRLHE